MIRLPLPRKRKAREKVVLQLGNAVPLQDLGIHLDQPQQTKKPPKRRGNKVVDNVIHEKESAMNVDSMNKTRRSRRKKVVMKENMILHATVVQTPMSMPHEVMNMDSPATKGASGNTQYQLFN